MVSVAIVIVTHDSELYLADCLSGIRAQSFPGIEIVIVDSGSESTDYLDDELQLSDTVLKKEANIGFSRANNVGFNCCADSTDYILFLNPDAFLFREGIVAKAVELMVAQPDIGCLTGKLLGYDLAAGVPTGRLDSTGIFRKWFGRWIDRGQGEEDLGRYDRMEEVPAACGAFLFCRRQALQDISDQHGNIFDPAFFLYKEDIELSLRLRKNGWKVVYSPEIEVYHCRGWSSRRSEVPIAMREIAAKNEVLLYLRHPSIYMVWAVAKYLLVRWLRL